MNVVIMTAPNRPHIQVRDDISMPELRQLVAHKFGAQGIGVPHSFFGVLDTPMPVAPDNDRQTARHPAGWGRLQRN